ncbi:MAG: hypothetical protein H8E84_05215 [Flavobacteriales bacterium]|nr:hypothetical protein [Flavobacteriales bacterium]
MDIIKPKTKVDTKIRNKAKEQSSEKRQVIIHGIIRPMMGASIDLFKDDIFLFPHGYDKKCKLVYSKNIAIYPDKYEIPSLTIHNFTMVFEGLPKDCITFDLIEDIKESGGFVEKNISRNFSDVYEIVF